MFLSIYHRMCISCRFILWNWTKCSEKENCFLLDGYENAYFYIFMLFIKVCFNFFLLVYGVQGSNTTLMARFVTKTCNIVFRYASYNGDMNTFYLIYWIWYMVFEWQSVHRPFVDKNVLPSYMVIELKMFY